MTNTRVVIVDDQDLVRNGLRLILAAEPDLDVVGEASDGQSGRKLVGMLDPDVVLMDVRMPGEDGITAIRQLAASGCRAQLLMLTTFDLDEYVYDALTAGAAGFLLKDMSATEIVDAVRQAARGSDALLAPALTRRLVERFARNRPRLATSEIRALASLTGRELDVLRLVARGLANHEIAAELYIGETTVKTHVSRVFAKLGLRDRVQAVIFAYESGVLTSP
ncbi:response regulator transcription factor [Microlunatus sp. Gsoil 973]|jgi:DNA-binding NarL/FixJ family response regulator|uniref:response regulator n=1 Tax=Microlunatus sp. Gsoil 973 TaxID=2672569 RepID=UPI0012B458CA|nr:response regulator transcription factor [Microlunatus sp. Gsoil 973]QGN32549.1 response regulator [Microlunatus sp. Gsoil 973]